MNSSPSSITICSVPPLYEKNYTVSKEEFQLFYEVDIILFTRFVLYLGRDMAESIHVMGFLLFLEDESKTRNLVSDLSKDDDHTINALAKEVVLCLRCIGSEEFPLIEGNHHQSMSMIPIIQSRLKKNNFDLKFFHYHRMKIIDMVMRKVNNICLRAFEDVISTVTRSMGDAQILNPTNILGSSATQNDILESDMNEVLLRRKLMEREFYENHQREVCQRETYEICPRDVLEIEMWEREFQKQQRKGKQVLVEDDIAKMFSGFSIRGNIIGERQGKMKGVLQGEEDYKAADDRTMFLTFSKGYPLSDIQVREFFTREFGDCIENLHMQRVDIHEQSLYARVVLRTAPMLEAVLGGMAKAKFTINGKHVWARKYVRRSPTILEC